MVGRIRTFPALVVIVLSVTVFSDPFTLHFSASLETEATDVFPDSFRALGRIASEPNTLMTSALRQPPPPPARSYMQVIKSDPSGTWSRLPQDYDPNAPDLLYTMTLTVYDAVGTGLSGSSIVTFENPEVLQQIPSNSLVYLRRFDAGGAFIESYDLTDPANHTIQWEVTGANDEYAEIDLLIVDKCMAADLLLSHSIDLQDFAVLASEWGHSGYASLADIFLDEKIDLKDLFILAEQWLCSCAE